MKRKLILAPALVYLASAVLLFACSKDGDSYSSGGGNYNNPPPPPPGGSSVTISGSSFSPGSLTIKKGATVTWTNNDNMAHTVTADDGSFTSGSIGYGGKYSRTFSTTGTFPYHCTLHSGMTGSVVVTD